MATENKKDNTDPVKNRSRQGPAGTPRPPIFACDNGHQRAVVPVPSNRVVICPECQEQMVNLRQFNNRLEDLLGEL